MHRMTPTHAAALIVVRESLTLMHKALEGLPDEAAGWRPAPGTNSLVVLVEHSITSTRFWLRNGSNQRGSLLRYRAEDRAPAFGATGKSIADLVRDLDSFAREAEATLSGGDERALEAVLDWRSEDASEPVHTGVEALLRGLAHLREHVGQAELMRDLWLARS